MKQSFLVAVRWNSRAFALVIFAWAGSAHPGTTPFDNRRPQASRYTGSRQCSFDKVLSSPDGRDVAIWASDNRNLLSEKRMLFPSSIVLGRMGVEDNSEVERFVTINGSGLRLFPIRWSKTGRILYVRAREPRQRILSIFPDGNILSGDFPLIENWKYIDINSISHGEISELNDADVIARISQIDGKSLIRGLVTIGSGPEILGVQRTDLSLVHVEKTGFRETGLNAGWLRSPVALPTTQIYLDPIAFVGGDNNTKLPKYNPFQSPLFDLNTGRIAGEFAPTKITLEKKGILSSRSKKLAVSIHNRGGIIVDASLSGDTLFALASFSDGGMSVFRLIDSSVTEKPLCSRSPIFHRLKSIRAANSHAGSTPEKLMVRTLAIDASGRRSARSGAPVLVEYRVKRERRSDVVVYFHGGPGGSTLDNLWNLPVLALANARRDVVSFEYSGSVGGGTARARRLANSGFGAFDEDLNALFAWIRRQKYRRVFLVSESFGTVPAMIALKEHRNSINMSFHIAPLLRLQKPEAWVRTGGGFGPVGADTQLAYEMAFFGNAEKRTKLADQIKSLSESGVFTAHDFLYFGDIDEISSPRHLRNGAATNITILPNASHAVLASRPAIWEEIDRRIGAPR